MLSSVKSKILDSMSDEMLQFELNKRMEKRVSLNLLSQMLLDVENTQTDVEKKIIKKYLQTIQQNIERDGVMSKQECLINPKDLPPKPSTPPPLPPKNTVSLKDRKMLVRTLMDKHGLQLWKYEIKDFKRKHGHCEYGTKTLAFSENLVHNCSLENIKLIVLHEIAHALTPDHHHDDIWRNKCLEIGGDGRRCSDVEKGKEIEAPMYLTCENRCFKQPRFKISNVSGKQCRKCKSIVFFVASKQEEDILAQEFEKKMRL